MITSARDETARLLLQHVPQSDRRRVINEAAGALHVHSPSTSISLIASLLQLQPEDHAQVVLLDTLQARIENGLLDDLVAFCEAYPSLKREVLAQSIRTINVAARVLRISPKRIFVPMTRSSALTNSSESQEVPGEDANSILEKASMHLHFVSQMLSDDLMNTHSHSLLESCVVLVGAWDSKLASRAQRLMFGLLAARPIEDVLQQHAIWARIQELTAASKSPFESFGFSLWLRWIISAKLIDHSIIRQPEYWELLVHGLRNGDSERRKSTLQVLRASVDACLADSSLSDLIAAGSSTLADPDALRKQYSRFCTVFETIVLGRYLNQVQECEADLDFLISTQCLVKPIWVFTLLASALDNNMQESNRKFVGAWILRSRLRIDDLEVYFPFLRNALLPWATQGSLFTASLRRGPTGGFQCPHGQKLSHYISDLIRSEDIICNGVIDAVLDNILGKANNNFAYAMAYLMDGIGRALEYNPPPVVDVALLEKACKILIWTSLLPEVAKDLILVRLWKMCYALRQANQIAEVNGTIASAAQLWVKVVEKSKLLSPVPSVQHDGPISSLSLERSAREKNLQMSLAKCIAFVDGLKAKSSSTANPADLLAQLEDIWSDLEYLEYPKGLLIALPGVLLDPHLGEACFGNSTDASVLHERRIGMVRDLLEQAETRSYLLYPLLKHLRRRILLDHCSISLTDAESFIVHLAENPASPSIDAQLEDATTETLRNVSPDLAPFNYEFYFDRRESHGVAAFLDLSSRLGQKDPDMVERILEHILGRWKSQKIPPPTISPWKNILQLQLMLLCLEQQIPRAQVSQAKRIIEELHYILSIEPLPRYRYLLEWMIIRVCLHHPGLQEHIFEELQTKDHHANPKFLASLMKIGVTIARTDKSDEAFALRLATVFVPLAASSKIVIRHEAQWQIPVLFDHAQSKDWKQITGNVAFGSLNSFVRSLERYGDPPLERQIDKLDPVRDHNLAHLVEGRWLDLDQFEPRQTSRDCFVTLYADDETDQISELPPSCLALGEPIATTQQKDEKAIVDHTRKILQNIDNISRALGSGPGPAVLQTKGNAYLESDRKRHEGLIVVASLVDNPYNLGGLSRVSEIFGAGAFYVPNTNVVSSRDFTGVSVSSHLHLAVLPLPAAELHAFLVEKKKREGFAVVGIEQTDRSVMLGSAACVIPEKCIVVMGSEREGIPALILGECDVLVEIPQVGITRSLNVQTAAGIILCEYAKQHTVA